MSMEIMLRYIVGIAIAYGIGDISVDTFTVD